MKQPDRGADGNIAVKLDQWQCVGRSGGGEKQGFQCAHGISHQRLVAQTVRIEFVQLVIDLGQRDVQVMAVPRQIRRHIGR